MQRSYFIITANPPAMNSNELRALAIAELQKIGNPQVYDSYVIVETREAFPLL
jgi:hypothetical protein